MKTAFVNLTPAMDVASVTSTLSDSGYTITQPSIDPRDARCMRVDLDDRTVELLRGRASDTFSLVSLTTLGALISGTPPPKPPVDDELRDRIAIAAMTTLTGGPDTVAINAYKMANAMLKAREATR